MKSFRIIMLLTLFSVLGGANILLADPGETDTVRIDSIVTYPGRTIALPITFFNDETLSAVEVVLDFDDDYLTVDSFSLVGSRLEHIDQGNVTFRDSANLLNLFLGEISPTAEEIDTGDGLLCNIYLTIGDNAGGQDILIDNGYWPFINPPYIDSFTTRFLNDSATAFIFPYITPGNIFVIDIPPYPDSVWVSRQTAMPGQSVAVDIYGYNSIPVKEIKIPLVYSSNSIIYNDTSFGGTLGELADQRLVDLRSELNQILITLVYSESSPLPAGEGLLATIIFDVDGDAPDEIVFLDTTRFLGAQSLEYSLTSADNNIIFTPIFTHGYIDIQSSTDVFDDARSTLPKEFALHQNSPNPFNPTTRIEFDLPRESFVSLNIYNVLGQKVKNLVDESLPAGTHEIVFDGTNENGVTLASGIYFYRLDTESFNQSRKMMLLK